jgi:phenylalanyl-tRNA synthetase beta chain
VRPASWRDPEPPRADFFAVKGTVEALLGGLAASFSLERVGDPFLDPGRAATITIAGRSVGWLGEVHPLVAAQWDIEETVAAFELDLDAVPEPETPRYRDVTSFPAVREDLAVVVPDTVSAAQVRQTVLAAGAPLLRDAQVFDVYRDPERVGEGRVSLALRLVYQAGDRTLTDEEVAERRAEIAEAIERELEGRIRA